MKNTIVGIQRNNCGDWWPKMVMLKVMQQYYSATGDKRVIDFMTKYFQYQLKTLPVYPLDHWTFWARYRGGDNLMSVYWLYNITGDDFLLDLGRSFIRKPSRLLKYSPHTTGGIREACIVSISHTA